MTERAKGLPGDGKSTEELFAETHRCLNKLKGEMERRRDVDAASTLLTDAYVLIEAVGRRLAAIRGDFSAWAPSVDMEEEQSREELGARSVSLVELVGADEEEATEERDARLDCFRDLMAFFCEGCRFPDDVTKNVLAVGRRLTPGLLRHMGESQTDIARKLGEKRATTSKREIRVVEGFMQRHGVKGYMASGGLKSATHREKCRIAQQGNTNRRDGQRRKLLAAE